MTKITHVAVGVLIKPNGEYLLASRPQGKPWAGWWEFPGGKIEAGETPEHALARELKEELGVTPTRIYPWLQRIYDYPEMDDSPAKAVHLHFYFVTDWQGELTPHEGQRFAWQSPNQLTVSPVLPANAPIMKALNLPPVYAISNMQEMGETAFLHALEAACNKGCKLIQIREKQLDLPDLRRFAQHVQLLAKPYGAQLLLNADVELARELGPVSYTHLDVYKRQSYDRVGFLLKGDRAQVVGRDPIGGWWQIACPPAVEGRSCWVSGGSQFTLLESAE